MFCLFNYLTGLKCPLCGFTRSIIGLINLDFNTFFYYNVLSIFYILVFSLLLLQYKIKYEKVIYLIIIVFGVVRNTNYYPLY